MKVVWHSSHVADGRGDFLFLATVGVVPGAVAVNGAGAVPGAVAGVVPWVVVRTEDGAVPGVVAVVDPEAGVTFGAAGAALGTVAGAGDGAGSGVGVATFC